MSDEKLITLGQLFKIKREQRKLSMDQVYRQTKVSSTLLSKYERDLVKPLRRTILKLVSFYGITQDELESIKTDSLEHSAPSKNKLGSVIERLDEIINAILALETKGILARTMQDEALSKLKMAHECISDVLIMDRLI